MHLGNILRKSTQTYAGLHVAWGLLACFLRSMIRLSEIGPETGLAGSGRPPCSEVKRGRGGRLLRDSCQVCLLYGVGGRKLTAPTWKVESGEGERRYDNTIRSKFS